MSGRKTKTKKERKNSPPQTLAKKETRRASGARGKARSTPRADGSIGTRQAAASSKKQLSSERDRTAAAEETEKTAQVGIQRNAIKHDLLLAAIPHPILVLDADSGFVYANAAAEVFFSISQALLKRMKLEDVLAFGSPLFGLVSQVREKETTVNEYGVEIASPKLNMVKLVDVYGGPLPDSPDCTVLMLQQRTMAQMIERQLTHRAAARSVSGMAAVLAHEIKNPLSGIRGAAQLLEQNLIDEDRVLSQLICSETDRIKTLVDRMEVFGDDRPLNKKAVNIHDVLEHVRRVAKAGFAQHLDVAEDYDPSLPALPANRDKLVQAFLNLIKNSAEAIGENADKGRIRIHSAFRPGVRLAIQGTGTRVSLPMMITIEDNGPGVPDQLKPHLFDPFVSTKRNGTGLGLALVSKIIRDHGGIIECESHPGRTLFRVLLPLQDETAHVAQ